MSKYIELLKCKSINKLDIKSKLKSINYLNLFLSISIIIVTALVSALFVNTQSTWFIELSKPIFYPNPTTFVVVWSILYFLLVFATYFVFTNSTKKIKIYYFITIILGAVWCLAFFTIQSIILGLITLIALVSLAYITINRLYKENKISFYFYIPYFVWLIFALILNYSIYLLN